MIYNRPGFIRDDPVSIPHQFEKKEDIEIAGFLAALIAWGRRETIVRNASELIRRMDNTPHDFLMNGENVDFDRFDDFVHRTFNGVDCKGILIGLSRLYQGGGGLEELCRLADEEQDTYQALMNLREYFIKQSGFQQRTQKHLASPAKGSSAKRLNMFFRWMVRNDQAGIDFGIWKSIKDHQLVCPLDVHTGNVGRKLGLLKRKQNDWKAAVELTGNLKELDPMDPVKYDIALFSLGAVESF